MKPVSIKSAACDIKVTLEVGLATSVPSQSSSRLEDVIGVPVIQSSPVVPQMDQQAPVQSGQSQVSLSSVAAGQPYLTSPEVNHQTITGVPPSHPSSDVLDLEANLTPSIQAVLSSNGQVMVPLEPARYEYEY